MSHSMKMVPVGIVSTLLIYVLVRGRRLRINDEQSRIQDRCGCGAAVVVVVVVILSKILKFYK